MLSVVRGTVLPYGKGTSGVQNTSLLHYCFVIRHPVLTKLRDRFLYPALRVDVLARVSSAHLGKTSNASAGAFQLS